MLVIDRAGGNLPHLKIGSGNYDLLLQTFDSAHPAHLVVDRVWLISLFGMLQHLWLLLSASQPDFCTSHAFNWTEVRKLELASVLGFVGRSGS